MKRSILAGSPFRKASALTLAGVVAMLLVPASFLLPGGPVIGAILFSTGLVLLLLPIGVTCPRCGHSVVLPAQEPFTFKLAWYGPRRICPKCGCPLTGHEQEAPPGAG